MAKYPMNACFAISKCYVGIRLTLDCTVSGLYKGSASRNLEGKAKIVTEEEG